MAEEALQSRDEFLSIASHELRTPLTTVILKLQSSLKSLLTQSLAEFSGEKMVSALTTAENQSQRLSRLIKDLLNVSLIRTGTLDIEKKRGNLTAFVKEIASRYEEKVKNVDSQLSINADKSIICMFDEIRLEQAIGNLITNAMKFGGGKPISISVASDKKKAYITIKDEGIGIPKAQQDHIFDLFYTKSQKVGQKGLGVGLYISQKIAQSHGGKLSVESNPKKGSTFILSIPISSS